MRGGLDLILQAVLIDISGNQLSLGLFYTCKVTEGAYLMFPTAFVKVCILPSPPP